jgi:uncharacterized membrane protein YeaQ/YmgE (transglycosylase-associated protein family)
LIDGPHITSMSNGPKQIPRRSGAKGKPKVEPGFRSPIRISIDHEALAALDKRAIAVQVGIGAVAGWLASWIVGGSGLLQYVLTGLAGSFVGGTLLNRLGIELGIRNPLMSRIVTGAIGAVVVVLLARILG